MTIFTTPSAAVNGYSYAIMEQQLLINLVTYFACFLCHQSLWTGKVFQFFLVGENISVKDRIKPCYESIGISSNHVIKLSVSLGKVTSVITFPKVSSEVLKSLYIEGI